MRVWSTEKLCISSIISSPFKFFRLYYNIKNLQNMNFAATAVATRFAVANRNLRWNIALKNPCEQVFSLILYKNRIKKSNIIINFFLIVRQMMDELSVIGWQTRKEQTKFATE